MTDLTKFQSEFLKQKKEYLEYLRTVDYDTIRKKVNDAISADTAEALVEAKTWLVSQYDPALLKDRSMEGRVAFMDQEIDSMVDAYKGITGELDKKIAAYLQDSTSDFMKEHDSKSPNMPKLRKISEEYAAFQNIKVDLDEMIVAYAGFSKSLKKLDDKVEGAIKVYKEADDCSSFDKVRKAISACKKDLAGIMSGETIKKNHPAYKYCNKHLEQIEPELERFEKDDFAGKRKNAEREMKIAGDFIELLACAAGKEKYAVLEEISSQRFSDFRPFEATVYLGDVAKDQFALVAELKSDAADNARRYQADEIPRLNKAVAETLANSKSTDELKAQKIRISNEYSGKADVLHQFSGQDSLRQTLSSGLSSIDGLVKEKNDAAEREKMQELAKAKIKIESEERLKREEHDKKYNFSKKEEENRALAGRVEGLEKDKKYLESEKEKQEATIGTLRESMSQLTPLIQEVRNANQAQQSQINKQLSSMESTLQSAGLPKLYQEVQGLRNMVEQGYRQGTDEAKLKSMIDIAVKTIDDKLNKLYEQMQKKEEPFAAKIDSAVKTIDGKIDKIYSQMQKKEEQAKKDGAVKQEQISKCAMAEQMGEFSMPHAPRKLPYVADIPEKPAVERQKLNYAVPDKIDNSALLKPKPAQQAQPGMPAGIQAETYIGSISIGTVNLGQTAYAEQRADAGIFDLAYELQGRLPPVNANLGRVHRRITGNENLNMLERFLSIEDMISKNTPAVNSKDDLNWLKWAREKLVDEINFGIVGRAIRKGGAVKEQFYDIINNAVDPYIAKCENALGRN